MPTVYDSGTSMASPAPAQSLSVTLKGHATGWGDGTSVKSYFQTDVGNTAQVDQTGQDTFNFTDSITMSADAQHDYPATVPSGNLGTTTPELFFPPPTTHP